MKKKLTFMFFIVSLSIISGCVGSGTDSGDTDIMPLAIGSNWTGKLWTLSEDGTAMFEEKSVYYVAESFSGDSLDWYVINHVLGDGDTTGGIFVFANGSQGLYSFYETDSGAAMVNLWAKYPASRNDTYYSGPDNSEFVRVIAEDTVITVLDVDYICNVYRREALIYSDHPPIDNYYLGPNIGFVQVEKYRTNISGIYYLYQLWELEYYQTGNPPIPD